MMAGVETRDETLLAVDPAGFDAISDLGIAEPFLAALESQLSEFSAAAPWCEIRDLRRFLHTLASSMGHVGAHRLAAEMHTLSATVDEATRAEAARLCALGCDIVGTLAHRER